MKIFITGGLGFIGSHLSKFLLNRGHEVTAVGRPARQNLIRHPLFRYVSGDTTQPGAWQKAVRKAAAVINLAGKTIFRRWTKTYKEQIYESRILTTRNVIEALEDGPGKVLCSASAVGYYGDRGDDVLAEDQPPGNDFLADLSVDWENEALNATARGIRVVVMRFGIILGKDGGALAKMIPPFKLGVGGPIGSGAQWFPWMLIDDLMAAILFSVEHSAVRGIFNFCAPEPVRNRDLAKRLGEVLHRPHLMPAPAFMIRLVLGEFGKVLLASQRAVPQKLLDNGFQFQYPHLRDALSAAITERKSLPE